MANAPKPAAEKRSPPQDRQNAQGDAEGAPQRPEAFDALNPAKQAPAARPAKKET